MKYVIILFFTIYAFSSCQDAFERNDEEEVLEFATLYFPYEPTAAIKEFFSTFLDHSNVNTAEYYKFLEIASYIVSDSLGYRLLKDLSESGIMITLKTDEHLGGLGMFNIYDCTMTFRDKDAMTQETVLEEILHAVQFSLYEQMMLYAKKNVEFEVKVFRDLWDLRVSGGGELSSYAGISFYDTQGYKNDYPVFIMYLFNEGWWYFFGESFRNLCEEWKGENLEYNPYFTPLLIETYWGPQHN